MRGAGLHLILDFQSDVYMGVCVVSHPLWTPVYLKSFGQLTAALYGGRISRGHTGRRSTTQDFSSWLTSWVRVILKSRRRKSGLPPGCRATRPEIQVRARALPKCTHTAIRPVATQPTEEQWGGEHVESSSRQVEPADLLVSRNDTRTESSMAKLTIVGLSTFSIIPLRDKGRYSHVVHCGCVHVYVC